MCVCVCSPLPEHSISHGQSAGWRGPGSSSWFLWTERDPAGWSTSSGGDRASRSLRSTPHPLRFYPLAPSNETALKSGSFSLHRSVQRSQPDQCRAENISAHVLTDSHDALELRSLTHLLSGSEHGRDVLEDDGSIRAVGEVDSVEGYQAPIGPVGRGAFLGFPRCFAF